MPGRMRHGSTQEVDMKLAVTFLGMTTMAMVGAPAQAHHGWTWYGNEAFSLTGEVVETDFGNPHDTLIVEADGQRWTVMMSPPSRSRRAGLQPELVQVGDTVTAYGHRRTSGDLYEMKTERLDIGDTRYDLYPDRS